METFGVRLNKVRKSRGITLEVLAKSLGTTKATISRYENNKRTADIDFARQVAEYFDVSADYLLGLKDSPETQYLKPTSIAAHFDREMSEEEEKQIRDFAQYLLDKKESRNG